MYDILTYLMCISIINTVTKYICLFSIIYYVISSNFIDKESSIHVILYYSIHYGSYLLSSRCIYYKSFDIIHYIKLVYISIDKKGTFLYNTFVIRSLYTTMTWNKCESICSIFKCSKAIGVITYIIKYIY